MYNRRNPDPKELGAQHAALVDLLAKRYGLTPADLPQALEQLHKEILDLKRKYRELQSA